MDSGKTKPCSFLDDCTTHPSGIRTMKQPHSVAVDTVYTVELPEACCPVSKNPLPGSTLTLTYRTTGEVLEVYSLQTVMRRFVGGFPGVDKYPAERNMEGMVILLAQMVADALQTTVRFTAELSLDTGEMVLRGTVHP